MKRGRTTQYIAVIVVLVCIISTICHTGMYADENKKKVIRVGYIGYNGFIGKNEGGSYEGYGVEFLNEIGKYTGYEYTYELDTWSKCLEKLKNHEIDIVCTAKYTKERDEVYDYTSQSFGTVVGMLYSLPNNENIYYEDYEHFNNKTIGFLSGSINTKLVSEYSKKHGFSYKSRYYSSDAEMTYALMNGQVDMIASENMVRHDELKLVGKYSCDAYYIMSYEGSECIPEINQVMSRILADNISYRDELQSKYYEDKGVDSDPYLTREEIEYIKEQQSIKIGYLSNRYPVSYYDEKKKQAAGIVIDIVDKLSGISGLKVEYVPMDSMNQCVKAIGNGEVDALAGIYYNNMGLSEKGYTFTKKAIYKLCCTNVYAGL